jgi:tetratricopeptide (TPR) repeat protein
MPNSASVLLNRAAAYIKLKKNLEALQDLNACVASKPELELAYFRKGSVQNAAYCTGIFA